MFNRKNAILIFFVILLPLIFSLGTRADMGRLMTSEANVREDFQKAIIIHDFKEEVLILGTDLKADKNTTILRFIPFPSEPSVSLAEGNPFQQVSELISNHHLKFVQYTKTMEGVSSSAASIKVLLDKRMGAHNVTAIKIDEITDFKSWVESFLADKGFSPAGNYEKVEEVAADYVRRGINYFVFDLVEVTPELTSIKPLVYRFKSDKFYYPLKTSNTFGGTGGINLVVITPGTMVDPIIGNSVYRSKNGEYSIYPSLDPLTENGLFAVEASTSAEISKDELKSVYNDGEDLFENEPIFLQVINYYGEYDFSDDILVDIRGMPREAVVYDDGEISGTTYYEELKQFIEVILREEDVTNANNNFTFDLLNKIMAGGSNQNIFFSPYSIFTALTMTYAGARDNTAWEMARVLHHGTAGQTIHQGLHELTGKVSRPQEDYQLDVANALWGQKNYTFKQEFLDLIAKYYEGGFNQVDFGQTDKTRNKINNWVAENTGDRIKQLLQQGDIDSSTALVLTNAIYFKGKWAAEFDKKLTKESPFYLENGDTVDVQMMSQEGKFMYGEPNEEIKIIELPYKGDDLSMVVILPQAGLKGIKDMDLTTLNSWLSGLDEKQVRVFLPRFSFESRYQLASLLRSLGMNDAFSGSADFSGITGQRDLSISKVIHQANIDVNEEGTEAAAATAVVMSKMMPELFNFRADHPFLFLIRHKPTNTILFMGALRKPA